MKKITLFLLSLIALALSTSVAVFAQGTTTARQVIIANSGKFESSPPFADYVTVESYNLSTLAVSVFNTIYTQSAQDVLINGNFAYVTAQDSVVMYNIDTYQRVAAVKDSGVNKMAIYNNQLIITKQYPIGRFRVEVLDATNLGMMALVDGIPGDCQGVAVSGTHAYVAVDSGYLGLSGRLAIINTAGWTLENIIDFGHDAIGINSVYGYGGYIFCVNKTPYGGGNVGSITRFNPADNTFVTNNMALNIGSGYGLSSNILYLGVGKSIGAYNLDTQTLVDTALITYFGSAGNLEVHSVGVDYLNNKLYTNIGNRTSFAVGVVFSFAGDSLTSYATGVNPDACAVDFRNPTGVSNNTNLRDEISVFPNPVSDFIGIKTNSLVTLNEIKIRDLTGRTILTRPVQDGEENIRISVSDYPSGVYLISFTSDKGTKVRKFVKR